MRIDTQGTKSGAAVAGFVVGAILCMAAVAVLTYGTAVPAMVATFAGSIAIGAANGVLIGAAAGAVAGAGLGLALTGTLEGALDGAAILFGIGAVVGGVVGGIVGGASYWNNGYSQFRQLKNAIGSPGEGREWHHIVEQNQIKNSGFNPATIHNTKNIVSIDRHVHRKISTYYSKKQYFTNGMSVRKWLAGQSYTDQYRFGLNIMKMYM